MKWDEGKSDCGYSVLLGNTHMNQRGKAVYVDCWRVRTPLGHWLLHKNGESAFFTEAAAKHAAENDNYRIQQLLKMGNKHNAST